jgi:hypothetical protein
MSIRVTVAAVITAAAMTMAVCGTAVAATSRAASPVQLTGVQLLSALLPASDFPAGYQLAKSSVYDSGRHLEKSPAKYHLSTMSCTSFANNFSKIGFGETATAGDAFENSTDTGAFMQVVYQFKTASTATSFFGGVYAIALRCPSFIAAGASSVGKTEVFKAPPVGGHRTIQVNQSGAFSTLMFELDSVITVAGTDVFLTGNLGLGAASPPSSPSARTTMLWLIKRVEAHR